MKNSCQMTVRKIEQPGVIERLRQYFPRAGEQLLAVNDRMRRHNPGSFLPAINAVQIVPASISDVVFSLDKTSSNTPHQKRAEGDHHGDRYTNRIFSTVENNSKDYPLLSMTESEPGCIFIKLTAVDISF